MRDRSAIVVGGGIGGLATAIALVRRGWQVRVLERSAQFTEVGAGISLWSNALRDLLLPLVPTSLPIRSLDPVLAWPPPRGITLG